MLGLEGVNPGEVREASVDMPESQERHPALGNGADEQPRVAELLATDEGSLGRGRGRHAGDWPPRGRGHAEQHIQPAGGVLVRRASTWAAWSAMSRDAASSPTSL